MSAVLRPEGFLLIPFVVWKDKKEENRWEMGTSGDNCSVLFVPLPWRGWVTRWGSDTASAPGDARLLRFQGELRAATGNPRGGSVLFTHLEYSRCHRGGLEGNIQTCSARQRSHQGLPSFWRQRVPAPPSTSNYPCWSRRGKSHLAFGLPKNTVFFSVYLERFLSSSSFWSSSCWFCKESIWPTLGLWTAWI